MKSTLNLSIGLSPCLNHFFAAFLHIATIQYSFNQSTNHVHVPWRKEYWLHKFSISTPAYFIILYSSVFQVEGSVSYAIHNNMEKWIIHFLSNLLLSQSNEKLIANMLEGQHFQCTTCRTANIDHVILLTRWLPPTSIFVVIGVTNTLLAVVRVRVRNEHITTCRHQKSTYLVCAHAHHTWQMGTTYESMIGSQHVNNKIYCRHSGALPGR